MKKRLVSGIRASANPHLGNYLGAMKDYVALQENENFERFYFIADLHALTTPFQPKELRKNSLEVAADYLALGIDPDRSSLFLQSQVPEHSELAWILNCITPLGELFRMTQFKEKSEQNNDSISAGLLNYPVLMAADILIYKGEVVPVGEDQLQHIELARVVARKFNSKFGTTFPEPQAYMKNALRIKSLMNPEKKMSKTGDEALSIADSPEEIKRKLKKAVTASDTSGKSAGVENLFGLLKEFGTKEQQQYFEAAYQDGSIRFAELKDTLAENIINYFAEFREKREKIIADPQHIAEVLVAGAERARLIARETISEVKEKVGLL